MARAKHPKIPLPPRDGLGASRVRHDEPEPITAFAFISRLVATQRHRHPDDDDAAVLRRFEEGLVVLIDGTPVQPSTPITAGTDLFFYRRPAPEPAVPYDMETVYEDADIMVVNKPPFLATMPRAAHITETATVRLRRATGNEEITPAHRLDRMTSGLLLFTKRRDIRGAYQELFARREVHKRYEAIAAHQGITAPVVWHSHIEKLRGEIASREIPKAEPNSETLLRAVERLDPRAEQHLQRVHGLSHPLARYVLEPVTGKTHQLRVHMCAAGVPIVGDPVYPAVRKFGDEDFTVPLRLTSTGLEFFDPISGVLRSFTADAWL